MPRKIKRKLKPAVVFLLIFSLILAAFAYSAAKEAFDKALYPLKYENIVSKMSEEYGVEKSLIFAVIKVESNFRAEVVSKKGAMGLMQITRDTMFFIISKAGLGEHETEELFDPEFNIRCGTWFLKRLYDEFGEIEVALCAYNAGRGNAKKWLDDPQYSKDGKTLEQIPFKETSDYVKKVLDAKEKYEQLYFDKRGE